MTDLLLKPPSSIGKANNKSRYTVAPYDGRPAPKQVWETLE